MSRARLIGMAVLAVAAAACADLDRPESDTAVVIVTVETCDQERLRATGVVVDDGVVATAAHTFEAADTFEVESSAARSLSADLVHLDLDRDVALLALAAQGPEPLVLGESDDGAEVQVITAADPEGLRTKPAVVLHHVSATLDGAGERAAIEIEADIEGGDSGAPVINEDGEVVGLVFATARDDNRGWVVATAEIEAALAQPKGDPVSLSC